MRKPHRFSVAFFLLILFGISLSAASKTPVEHFLNSGHGTAVEEATREIAALFNSIQDEIEVTVTVTGAYYDKLIARAVGGVLPDVATAQRSNLTELASLCTPLEPFVERSPLKRILVPPAVEHSRIGGDLIQLPLVVQPLVTFYNEELFALAGLVDPFTLHTQGDWTWESVIRSARRIARDTTGDGALDIWGVNVTASSIGRAVLFVTQAGGYFFDRPVMPTESRFNTPPVAEGLSFVHSLIHEHGVMPPEGAQRGQARQYSTEEKQVFSSPVPGPSVSLCRRSGGLEYGSGAAGTSTQTQPCMWMNTDDAGCQGPGRSGGWSSWSAIACCQDLRRQDRSTAITVSISRHIWPSCRSGRRQHAISG